MSENEKTKLLLHARKLENGIHVSIYDMSKKLAGDRWLVKVKCEATFDLREDFLENIHDVELKSYVKQHYQQGLTHTIFKERIFIDEADKKDVRELMLCQLDENALAYMAGESFPQKFFDMKMDALKKDLAIKKEMDKVAITPDEDDEPADFSACFKD